ncbi:MAG: M15 family metallopeptidase [Blautia sp.]|nr:M15 family metallopeptidase [Blautia sp.]MCM1200077.1 M15 family metallopeptidase [Bacteroides fragilis]
MKKQFTNQLLKPLLFLAALILVCSFLSRTLAGSESIVDYVNRNRQAAEEKDAVPAGDAAEEDTVPADEAAKENSIPAGGTSEKDAAYDAEEAHIDDSKDNANGDTASMPQKEHAKETPGSASSAERTVYQEGFYYEPLSEETKARITGISYPVSSSEAAASAAPFTNILEDDTVPAVSYDDLRYLSVLYYDFNGEVQSGELICNKGIADDLMEIFHELYLNEYQIEKIRLVDEYQADDTASITDNNTSCFNYRVVDGTTSLSRHALGCAIDINPFYNPYVVFNKDGSGETYISPPGSEIYVDRTKDFPYKIDETDLCYKLFKEHGFTWGGNWNSCKDYQHFQKVLN